MRSGEVDEARREKPRGPLAGRHADDARRLVAKGHAPAVDGRGRFGHALRHREQILTAARQPMPVGRALEEAGAERLLELAQAADDGGLAKAQRPGSSPQTSGLGDSQKHLQIIPLHGATVSAAAGKRVLRIRSRVIHE